MSLFEGRKGFLGFAKEATPGDPTSPTIYIPFINQSLQAKHNPIGDISAKGTRDGQRGSVSGKKWGEGDIEINVDETKVGNLFYMLLGSVSSSTVSGNVKDHTFSRNNSNTPQTYSITLDRGTDKKIFPYCAAKDGEFHFADELATLKTNILSKFPVTSVSGTLTVVSGFNYAWKDALVKFGDNISGASSASATPVSEFTLNIENNTFLNFASGNQQPVSINSGTFRVYGNFKIYFEDTTQLDKYRNLTMQALILKMNGRGLESGYQETITFNLPKIRLDDVVVDTPLDDFNVATYTFEAEYDADTSKMLDIVMRNITSSY